MAHSRVELQKRLRIDQDDLDSCLVEQPELFRQVAEAYVLAAGRRDALKLDFEEETAETYARLRAEAIENQDKVSEATMQSRITIDDKIKDLSRKLSNARVDTDEWGVLKESFQQRSWMLRELVALRISELHQLSAERGSDSQRVGLRDSVAQRNRDEAAIIRRQQPRLSREPR